MKQFFTVFALNFKCLWRDPISVSVLVAFPIVLILILGTALSSYIAPETNLESAKIAVATDDPGGAFSEFLLTDEISAFLTTEFTDEVTARELLEKEEVRLIVHEKDGELSVVRSVFGNMYSEIALSVIDSYKQTGTAIGFRMAHGGDFADLSGILGSDITVTEQPLNQRAASAVDYYAVTMLVMILLYTGMNGLELFKKGMLSETGARVRSTPVSRPALIGGLLAASTVTSYLQGMVTFVFSAVFYGVDWGDNIPLILLTLFAVTLFSQSFSIFLIMLVKSPNMAAGIMQGVIWSSTFVSGGYTKVDFGDTFRYAPNALAHNIIFGSIFGGDKSQMTADLLVLFGAGLVLFILAFLLGRRKLA